MTDRSKFEQMLEHLVNEDTEKAQEIFHQLVVEKSREIYENILAEDFEIDEEKDEDETDDEMDESKMSDEDDEEVDENFGFGEADDVGGDPADDMIDDMGMDDEGDDMGDDMSMDDEGDDMGGEEDLEDRVVDLEDAIDDLRAEFEKLMGEEGDDMGDDMSMDDEEDMGDDMSMDDEEGAKESYEDNFMREYIEKVGNPKHGDNGSNAKSTVAGKNDMGGTAGNITSGGESTKGGTQGGLLNPSTKDINSGNINVPGGNAGKTAFKKKEPGHGAEKKSTGDNGDRGSDSPINGVKSRAK